MIDPPSDNEEDLDNEEMETSNIRQTKKGPRELTKLEKDIMEKKKKKHKENLTKPQVVQGKTFKGQAFISKPEKIIFRDFNIGESMTQTIYITNVSFSFNSFKLLSIRDSIKDFFEIFYTPSGRISAGMSTTITIRFTPQLNQDIFDELPLLAEAGPISIPIECTCKKAIAEIENVVIDFGKVIFGEDCTRQLKINNKGALSSDFTFKTERGEDFAMRGDASSLASSVYNARRNLVDEDENKSEEMDFLEKCLSQLNFVRSGRINGYSFLLIPMKYTPSQVGPFQLPLQVYFDIFQYSPPVNIILKGECVEVPIYVEKTVYDFEICLMKHCYREKLVFFNRSQNAMKIQIVPPKETKNFFEFNPILGYIQGNSKFEIWVKLNAEKEIWNMCSKFITGDVLDIPFKLIGADQVMPVLFNIKARLTIDKINISPVEIDFGKIYENSASRIALSLENCSWLPQEIVFYPLPKEISLEPDLIPLRILPKETLQINLVYRGREIKKDNSLLTIKTITGTISTREYRIPYSCDVIKCPLQFNPLKLDFPVLQVNEKHRTLLEIKNTTLKDMMIEFFIPEFEICGLTMTPMFYKIEAEKGVDINIEFISEFKKFTASSIAEIKQKYLNDPSRNFNLKMKLRAEEEERKLKELEEKELEEKNKAAGGLASKLQAKKPAEVKKPEQPAAKGAAPSKKPLSKKEQQDLEDEQKRQAEIERQREEEEKQRKLELERSFDVNKELMKMGGKFLEFDEDLPSHSQHFTWLVPCYFKTASNTDSNTCVIYLEISTVTVEKSLVLDKNVLDFGDIAVGFCKNLEFLVTNQGNVLANLKKDLLPLYGGFSILNALRPVEPGNTKNVIVQFQPHEERKFKESLRIFSETSSVSIILRGKGVNPEVKVVPESGLLNMGGVILGETMEKSFKIVNISNFRLNFQLLTKARGLQNKNGSQAFGLIPSQGSVDASQEIEIKVIFQPDRISEKFFELISVDVPNQKDEKRLFIYGNCFPRQTFVKYFKPWLELPKEEALNKKVEAPLDFLKVKDEEIIFSSNNMKILLEFKKPKDKNDKDELCFLRKIIVGNCKLQDPKNEKNGNYEIIMPKEDKFGYFGCDNPKGAIASGQEIVITFKYNPPQIDQFIAKIEALEGIGQWIEQKAELKLSGGFLKPGMNDLWSFELILKAYINQI